MGEQTLSKGRPDELMAQFVRLTRPYHARLFRIALSLCGDRDEAADLTQEALIRAFRAFDRFRLGAPVLPWLARILRNYHLDTLKSGRARHEVSCSRLGREEEPGVAATPSPLHQVEQGQLLRWLQEELQGLSEDQRLVVVLCDAEGLSYQEAAEVLGVPVGTVRSRLSRARETLRHRLGGRAAAPGPAGAADAVGTDDPFGS